MRGEDAAPVRRAFWWVFGACAAWLLASLFLVNMEFDDGYTTIANSQYFLGISESFFWQRGPMLAWMLVPAEWLATALGLHPLDVRVHHALMALYHLAYLVGVWMLLARTFGARPRVLLALVASLFTVVFFSYAPFISHDIFPGFVVLLMLHLANALHERPTRALWWSLVGLGAFVAMIKQTYAIVWIAVLAAGLVMLLLERDRRSLQTFMALAAGAALSAAITWIGYAWALRNSFPDAPWILRPLAQSARLVGHYQEAGPIHSLMDQWVYVRNLPAYGVLAMALVVPGLALSLRAGTRLQRSIAIAWLSLLLLMHLIAFKEVRYLTFLAPLTACLIVPALDRVWRLRRAYQFACLGLLALGLMQGGVEAARIVNRYYRAEITQFLRWLPPPDQLRAPIVMTERLSFISPEPHAFRRDRFHRITNIVDDQLRMLYGYTRSQLRRFRDIRHLDSRYFQPGSTLILVTDVAARAPPFRADNRSNLQDYFVQLLAIAEPIELSEREGRYWVARASTQPILLLPGPGIVAEPLTDFSSFATPAIHKLYAVESMPARVTVLGFRIREYCNRDGCQSY